ncbi:ATP-binding protein [Streptomyces sp. NPDC006365]|uniref:ATP-binding protein n=1 Tax=Streptomyces sp. NPDC006365 TaxID=3364744 RepID=UPI0036957ED2
MVSELATNAIHARFPTAVAPPRTPRRTRTFDEGGRGLLLVARLARSWGTRHTREGKVMRAEQPLPAIGSGKPPDA